MDIHITYKTEQTKTHLQVIWTNFCDFMTIINFERSLEPKTLIIGLLQDFSALLWL